MIFWCVCPNARIINQQQNEIKMRKTIFTLLLVGGLFTACPSGNAEANDPALQEEIQDLESTAEELEDIGTAIDSSAAQVDALLNDL